MLTAFNFGEAIVMVTGAGGGMGRSIAESFAARGGTVYVTDIEESAAQETAQLINVAGGHAIARQLDVTDANAMDALANDIFEAHGRIDALINNAGVTMRPFRAIWDASAQDFEWMMRINYFGVINGLRSFIPRMREQGSRAHIVNTSSFAAIDTIPGHGMYTASKAAVDGISNVLRAEFEDQGDDIGVTILYPGQVTTRIGTSERLRDAAERSDVREVKAYEMKNLSNPHNEPLAPEFVGDMVITAIERNAPFVLTHPAPTDNLKARVEKLNSGYFGLHSQASH
ncbi:short chain dehydrogenase [Corynebacterium suranareeae]|uniref:Short chain dehydrogenase n=1 Tax=Corynebacterium suranareeae TaxID=2506452 RepID=A0A160PQC1_9CORY|nr:SDR family NAD(P)-dependent oxidoreductase [Corynebacterium suranareeae]BAU94420.1 short chain dehydrogenase [Corynebacterium suranareeae]